MHHTATTAITIELHAVKDHREDVWVVHVAGFTATDRVLQGSLAFDAAYWDAQCVENVTATLRAALLEFYPL